MLQNSQKVPVSESLFNNVSGWGPWNFIKKEILAQVFSCEFCEISENNFSYRIPPVAASGIFQKTFLIENLIKSRL